MPGQFCALKNGETPIGSSRLYQLVMTHSRAQLALSDEPLWFCLRTQPKHEHIAAATLTRNLGLEVFHPRLRLERATRRVAVQDDAAIGDVHQMIGRRGTER